MAGTDPEFISLAVTEPRQWVQQDRSIKSEIRTTDNGRVLPNTDALADVADSLVTQQELNYTIAISVLATIVAMLLLLIIVIAVVWAMRRRALQNAVDARKPNNDATIARTP